jgi:branched-chain amino acid transport system ATP-binding protein
VSSNSLLSISNLTVEFGGLRALDDVFLNLESNQVVGLIGPNGAGKTTLFNAICGLVKPTSGTLTLNGQAHDWPATHDLTSLGISRTLQGVGLFPDLTVAENVMIGAQKFAHTGLISAGFGRNKKDERALRERAHWALERVYAGSL